MFEIRYGSYISALGNIVSRILFVIFLGFISFGVRSQVYSVRQEYCKKKDMEIITGDSIPKGYVIMQSGDFNKNEIGSTLESLTKKQINKMKTYCKWRHCCKVFIAFTQIESFKDCPPKELELNESKVHFYVLAPAWEIELK